MTGIVQAYNSKGGYGFITPHIGEPENAKEVFFHVSQCVDRIAPPRGAEVSFTLVRGNNGPQAARVELVEVNLLKGTPKNAI